jgi:DNA polymerase III sliding clamp (beta) subunit (PCNA family)
MFEVVFAQTSLLKKIVDAVRELNESVSFDVSTSGISLQVSFFLIFFLSVHCALHIIDNGFVSC